MSTSLVGRTLGKYEIIDKLGKGGMAAVFKGYQRDVDRYVAIKVLPPHPGQDPKFIERFRLEARTIARLQHPHILPLYDYGDQDDVLYLVMPYVGGGSLRDRLKEGAFSLEETERILGQVAAALDYAHKQGMIHRDIKPDNILLDGEGNALLADFGIVKLLAGGDAGVLTATDALLGTPAYMAPEQAQGMPLSKSADLYSLGVVVYEMLSGQQPFTADTPMAVLVKHVTEPVPSICELAHDLPPDIEAVMQRALAKEPESRYSTATEFAVDFSKAIRGDSTQAARQRLAPLPQAADLTGTQVSSPTPPTGALLATQPDMVRSQAANRLLWLGGGAALILLVAVVVLLLFSLNQQPVVVVFNPSETPAATTPQPTATVVASGPTAVPVPTFGHLSFSTTNRPGDTADLSVENLAPPGQRTYAAWLHSTLDGTTLALGRLQVDALGNGGLASPFVDGEGRNLPTRFNVVLVTLEDDSPGDAPAGETRYSGFVPPGVTGALAAILSGSPSAVVEPPVEGGTGLGGYGTSSSGWSADQSLLDGARQEAQIGAQHAGLASGASNVSGMHTHAEHTVNILLGTQDDLNGDGSPQNPGLGYGVPFFLDRIEANLAVAAEAADGWPALQSRIEQVRVCAVNARLWVNEIVGLEQEMLASDDFEAVRLQATQSTELAGILIEGTDLNGNGNVEPFEGECGLQQIADFGMQAGNMDLVEGPPPE